MKTVDSPISGILSAILPELPFSETEAESVLITTLHSF